MSEEQSRNQGYSAGDYADLVGFESDWRDTWWSQDYLELLANRLGFAGARRVLDVGCGAGHWGQRIGTLLAEGAEMVGVDHEPEFLAAAAKRAEQRPHRFQYLQAPAEALPFDDDSFDLVTCQTVLMHVADAPVAVAEMVRVTRPGGVVLAAEPNNLSNALSNRVATPSLGPDAIDQLFAFEHHILRGKLALGHGDGIVGEHLPRYFAEAGLGAIRVSTNDQCAPFVPPYDSPTEQLTLDMLRKWQNHGVSGWGDRAKVLEMYLAGGGDADAFDPLFELSLGASRAMIEAIDAGTFYGAGGFVMYVVAGTKRRRR